MAYINGRQVFMSPHITIIGEQWRKVIDETTTTEVAAIEESVDLNGNALNLKKARIVLTVPAWASWTAAKAVSAYFHSDKTVGENTYIVYCDITSGASSTTNKFFSTTDTSTVGFGIDAKPYINYTITGYPNQSAELYDTDGGIYNSGNYIIKGAHREFDNIDLVKIVSTTALNFPIGTRLEVWGVDNDD